MRRDTAEQLVRAALHVIAAADIKVDSAEVRPDQTPEDDYDDEFGTSVDVSFTVSGPTLAKLLGKQQRVMQKTLKSLDPKAALRLLGGRNAAPLLTALRKSVAWALHNMAQDEFDRGAKLRQFDFEEDTSYWSAQVGDDRITFDVGLDATGRWA